MKYNTLHRYPFLRLFSALALGIGSGDLLFFMQGDIDLPLTLCLVSLLFILITGEFIFRKYIGRWIFGLLLFIEVFLGGMWLSNRTLKEVNTVFPRNESIYQATLTSSPLSKKKSIQATADIKSRQYGQTLKPFHAKVVLFFPKTQPAVQLKKGDVLFISAHLSQPSDYGNPDSFDYARYLHRKGIGGTGYIQASRWKVVGHIEDNSFADKALRCRETVLNIYRSQHWNKDILSVVSALTVGYKDELSSDIRETYSITGASHILALSGLHIGFLYALFLLLLRPLGKSREMSILRGGIIITLLWLFAFFTGLSPSVVRSVIMFSLFATANALLRDNYSLNTLLAAGFLMLIYSPEWLFDISFQLSFSAVAALLLFEPFIEKCYSPRTYIGHRLWQLSCVSIAAQLGTLPLIIYYFSRFSVYFILSGFVVIPLASLIMYATLLLLLTSPIGILQTFCAFIVKTLVEWMNGILSQIEAMPYSSVDGIWIYPIEVLCFYLILTIALCLLHTHRAKYAYAFLISISLIIGLHYYLWQKDLPGNSIAFYNVRSCPAVHCIAHNRESWLICANNQSDTDDMQKKMGKYWNHQRLYQPHIIKHEISRAELTVHQQIISYRNKRIGIISDNRWRFQGANTPLQIDYLYICKGYKGRIEELLRMFQTKHIILDSSLSKWRKEHYKMACDSIGIPTISLGKGYYQIYL